jgi:two-component system, LytTR family, sensor kinase
MNSLNIAALINLLGWSLGLALYAMLLSMSFRRRPTPGGSDDMAHGSNRLVLATAILGLIWNAGSLAIFGLQSSSSSSGIVVGLAERSISILGAASLAALGFLPAVVVHSAIISSRERETAERWKKTIVIAAYTLSSFAAVMHFYRALVMRDALSRTALQLLTAGFILLMIALFALTGREPGQRRAVWATALAVFAVSAMHLSVPGEHEAWYAEIIGHHASLPLVLAILYQDYRFAFADIFLKRALALVALVVLAASAFGICISIFESFADESAVTGIDSRLFVVLLVLWIATALLFPVLQRATTRFVDRLVLKRDDYAELRERMARLAVHTSPGELLDDACAQLKTALTAARTVWREIEEREQRDKNEIHISSSLTSREGEDLVRLVVPTITSPRYEILIGELGGGRRLLSDDIEMLEAIAVTIARRIDALRVTHERYERERREQEIAKLATEAQLRALRSQINPHFLFNALTTIGYLINESPPRALKTLMRLTELLRRVLRSNAEWTTLDEELKLIEAYLDIERARFEERLQVSIEVAPNLRQFVIPSLVIQPLVENAIKHGIAPLKAGGEVKIEAIIEADGQNDANRLAIRKKSQTENMLVITVRDSGAGASDLQLSEGRRQGVGLQNVEQRLRLYYGDCASVTLHFESSPGKGAQVSLRVPARLNRFTDFENKIVLDEQTESRELGIENKESAEAANLERKAG